MKNIAKYKRIKNLPKFDIGTVPINSGYQAPQNNVPIGYAQTPTVGMSSLHSGQKQQNLGNALSRTSTLASSALGAAQLGTFGGKTAFGLSSSAASAVGGTLMAIPAGIQLVGDINAKNEFNGLTGADLSNVAGKTTEYVNGVAYQNIGGIDQNSIMNAASARDFGENFNLTASAVGVGAGIGTAIMPGIGTAIGAGLGFLGSALFGWGDDEEEEQRRRINNFYTARSAANEQNYSVAASQGLRNENNAKHADSGKPSGESWSPSGINNKKPNGLAGKGESLYDPMTGDATLITKGTKRVDNVPVNVKDRDVIFGNLQHAVTGMSFADEAAPITAVLEQYNKLKNPKADKTTQEVQNREVEKATKPYTDYLNWLSKEQEVAQMENDMNLYKCGKSSKYKCGKSSKYKCGKTPKYDSGFGIGALSSLPGLLSAGVGLNQMHEYAKDPLYAPNLYVQNTQAANALNTLAQLRYDPYGAIQAYNDEARQAQYLYTHMPFSTGQKMTMLSQLYNNKTKGLADIYAQAQEKNNAYRAAYADAAMKYGADEAARRQQANALQNDMYAKAQAAKRKGIETGQYNLLNGVNSAFGNFFNNFWTDKNIKLYRDYVDNEKLKNITNSYFSPTSFSTFKGSGIPDFLRDNLMFSLNSGKK